MLTSTIGKGKYGSDLVVDLMQRYEIPYVALNPGSTFRDANISKWSDEFQQLVPVDLQIIADTVAALPDLLTRVRSPLASDCPSQTRVRERTEAITQVHAEVRQRWQEEARKDWAVSPSRSRGWRPRSGTPAIVSILLNMRSTSIEMIYSNPYESNEAILRVPLTVPAPQ